MSRWEQVTVVGAGTMGHGIVLTAARTGIRAVMVDVSPEALERGLNSVRRDLEAGVDRGKVTPGERDEALARIGTETDLGRALEGASIAIEAVPESLELKRRVFGEMESGASPGLVLATNTSSIPVSEIAAAVKHPERVVGMHFFNPVHIMPLVEVVRAPATGEETVAAALDLGRVLGKECIVVRDSPGFATSRLGVLLGLEAIRMVEDGVASAEDIDKAMTLGYRHPLGPLRLTDLVGLDVRLAIAEQLFRSLDAPAFRPPELLRRMVAEGKLGKKSGQGFYRWT